MCGRFANSETIPVMRRHYEATGPQVDWSPSWNICPTRQIPVLLGGTAGRRIGLMRWGWNPNALNGRLLINCRGEEAHAKRMFQEPLARRRCVVPATAFYEWQPGPTKSTRPQPFAFVPANGGLISLGALWEPVGQGDSRSGAVILMTVPANDLVAPVHDRMPLVIPPTDLDGWLDPDVSTRKAQGLLVPSPPALWRSWAISRAISTIGRDGPEIQDVMPGVAEHG
jgi:putative SOS response-associated peptidase YedK